MSIEFAPKEKEGHSLYVLISLLILNLALLSLQITDPSGTLLIRKMILFAGTPFLSAAAKTSASISRTWNNYLWLKGAREENHRLQDTIQQLALQQSALEQLKLENNRLRQLLAINDTLPFTTIGTRVIARAPSYLSGILYIDRGHMDGIQVDMPALSSQGILGRVVLVSRYNSQVQLITNPDSSVGAMIERTRSPGVLRGSGNTLLDLDYISNTDSAEVGDLVVTSGLDAVYPKGLLLGKVAESRKGNSVFRVIRVEPSADLLHIEEVSLLWSKPKEKAVGGTVANQ